MTCLMEVRKSMTKFLESLVIQLDRQRRVKSTMPKFLGEPMALTESFVEVGHLDQYTLSLNWTVPIWFSSPVHNEHIDAARKEAIMILAHKIYGEIHGKLSEIKYLVKCNEPEKAVEEIQELMVELMTMGHHD